MFRLSSQKIGDLWRFRASIVSSLLMAGTVALLAAAGCGGDDPARPGADPTLTSATPDSGNVGTLVEITGTDFVTGVQVSFGPYPCTQVEYVSPNLVRAWAADSLDAGTTYDITLSNPGGGTAVLTDAYKAVVPELLVVNGVSRPSGGQGSPVILDGKSFGDLLGKGTVYFTDGSGLPVAATVSLPENWTNEFIVATVPAAAETGPLWVETPTGSTQSVIFMVTQSPTFSPSLINWTGASALPEPLQGTGAVFVSAEDGGNTLNQIFVTGGANGSVQPVSTVYGTEVDGTGSLLPWSPASDLPVPMAFHGMAVATPFNALMDTMQAGYLFVLGGADSAGAPMSGVFRATLGRDGQLGGWSGTTDLPVPLHSMGVTIFRSWIFVAGGATHANSPVSTVYRAHIEFDGELGPWEVQTALPAARAYAPLVQFAGNLYLVGGESAAVAPGSGTMTATATSTIYRHSLNLRTVDLSASAWTSNPSTLIKSAAKHSVIVAGATILVSGGLYNGAGSSATEHQYAEMLPDYSVGSFHGATGSQTIGGSSGAGGVPFFNHSAITYADDLGQAHVIIIGGADVNSPTTTIAETYSY